jgi:amino acid transporter
MANAFLAKVRYSKWKWWQEYLVFGCAVGLYHMMMSIVYVLYCVLSVREDPEETILPILEFPLSRIQGPGGVPRMGNDLGVFAAFATLNALIWAGSIGTVLYLFVSIVRRMFRKQKQRHG